MSCDGFRMILQREENKGVGLTGYVCMGSGAMEYGRRGASGEESASARLNANGAAPGYSRREHPGHKRGYAFCADSFAFAGALNRRTYSRASSLLSVRFLKRYSKTN